MSHPLVTWAETSLPDMLADLEQVIRCESPSSDHVAVARSADLISGIGARRLGFAPERLVIDGVTHLRWQLGSPDPDAPRVLLLAHHDTVWPVGSIETHPFSIQDGVIRGPGSFDMLTGLVMAIHAAGTFADGPGGQLAESAITLLVTGDEEVGSNASRALIEQEARGCVAALVLEAAGDDAAGRPGALKIGRKGTSMYRINIAGRAAHAGTEPEKGINSLVELAHQVVAVQRLADASVGTTVVPTVARSGTTTNTVPGRAWFDVDVRALTIAEQHRVDEGIRELASHTGATLTVTGGINRPPLETAAAQATWERAQAVAESIGIELPEAIVVGGASDGNITAGVGVPTLDGLGAVGGGAHADHEHAMVADIPIRTALLVGLIRDLLGGEAP
ncbi:M20 family metallopeptidase [Microbacterium marinilacus]|uniref:M20 family metallopeptidase n=1 Tax=Microbacterium marinilacus TaxID=415209 RepID=A0ABP7BFC0_9MICO|nr:M20 family metallopeptidase [Microbacterium marinilacus]MBY0689573.1 M20 family metallopeptidase [Microbacterium marinilacus]